MSNTEIFKKWHRIECARRMGLLQEVDAQVDEQMRVENLKVEYIKDKSNGGNK